MTSNEILDQLPKLTPNELAQVQAVVDELAGETWLDDEELSNAEKAVLDATLAEYGKSPNAGSTWEQVEARIREKFPR
jgi:putative addiction module component (TIGR02574 family)